MNVDDSDPIALSALQHWAYCPRQCGLIHLEQAFDENLQTQRGRALHSQVDQPGLELRRGLRIERALPLWSDALGLIGKADVVEFEPDGTPYPVEYKHGSRHKAADIAACDDLQLAAQALCLEEMTSACRARRRAVLCQLQAAPRGAHHGRAARRSSQHRSGRARDAGLGHLAAAHARRAPLPRLLLA